MLKVIAVAGCCAISLCAHWYLAQVVLAEGMLAVWDAVMPYSWETLVWLFKYNVNAVLAVVGDAVHTIRLLLVGLVFVLIFGVLGFSIGCSLFR